MAVRLRIALVACLALLVLMEEVNPILAGGDDYKKLEARVKRLENTLCGSELNCKREATSPSKQACLQTKPIILIPVT